MLWSLGAKVWGRICRIPLFPCPASYPRSWWVSWPRCSLGEPALTGGMSLGSGSPMDLTCSLVQAASWSRGSGSGSDVWVLPGTLGPCFLPEILLLPGILPSCIFSNFPPQGFQSSFSICGSGSCCARFQLSAWEVVRGAGRRRCSATGTRRARGRVVEWC